MPRSWTARSSCPSATRPATGATSWSASRSRTRPRRPTSTRTSWPSRSIARSGPTSTPIYMDAVQAMTGQGGWPMSVFLTPDGRPFYGGTYFPDQPRHGMPSFRQVLAAVATRLDGAARRDRGRPRPRPSRRTCAAEQDAPDPPARAALQRAAARRTLDPSRPERLRRRLSSGRPQLASFDAHARRLGQRPQVPAADDHRAPAARASAHAAHAEPRRMAERTLEAMAEGGIYDHLGGGFARYATDAAVARAALREDALRQRPAGARLHATPGR